jgi:hypothetical protein
MNDNAATIEALRAQERALILSDFDEEAAYSLGIALHTKCAAAGTAVVIDIRTANIDPVDGPNLFGGKVLVRDVDSYRWKALPRRTPFPDWVEVPINHRFNDLSHRKNSRGIGLVDMAYALMAKRKPRVSGTMALHCLEMEVRRVVSEVHFRIPLRTRLPVATLTSALAAMSATLRSLARGSNDIESHNQLARCDMNGTQLFSISCAD